MEESKDITVRGKCETLEGVRKFHKAFNCHTSPTPWVPVLNEADTEAMMEIAEAMEMVTRVCHDVAERTRGTPANRAFLRLQLIQEEVSELARALQNQNLVAALDALTDTQYVLDGTYLSLGLADLKLPAFREVQRSNMTKLGADGSPLISDAGRVVKGPDFEPPKLKELLYRYFYGGNVDKEQDR